MGITRNKAGFTLSQDIVRPNLLINGDFSVWQRGTTFNNVGPSLYTADRWQVWHSNTVNIVRQQITNSGWNAKRVLRVTKPVTTSFQLIQPIETGDFNSGLSLGGTYTFSTLARQVITAETGDIISEVVLRYRMADGSTSNDTSASFSDKTLAPGEIVGKTVTLHMPACSDTSQGITSLEMVLVLSNAPYVEVDFLNMKLELGDSPTEFIADDPQTNLAKCHRYFYRYSGALLYGAPISNVGYTSWLTLSVSLPVPMRTTSDFNLTNVTVENEPTGTLASANVTNGTIAQFVSTDAATGGYFRVSAFDADAEL